jgi:hypothetical protein
MGVQLVDPREFAETVAAMAAALLRDGSPEAMAKFWELVEVFAGPETPSGGARHAPPEGCHDRQRPDALTQEPGHAVADATGRRDGHGR